MEEFTDARGILLGLDKGISRMLAPTRLIFAEICILKKITLTNMKKLIIICGLLLSAATFTQAQHQEKIESRGKGLTDESPEAKVKELDKELKLKVDQKAKLIVFFSDYYKVQKEIMESAKIDDIVVTAKKKMRNRNNLQTKINSVLDENQKVAYLFLLNKEREELEKKMRANMH